MPEICVVHLVWVPLGTDPFRQFLSAYVHHRAGIDHELLVVFNGFTNDGELDDYKRLLVGVYHRILMIRKHNLDIQSYFAAVNSSRFRYYCFLNSYSRVQDHDWLKKLYSHVIRPDIGIVGATGSWESMYSNFISGMEVINDPSLFRRIWKKGNQYIKRMKKRHRFAPFPNYHIRTNGFIISRDVMLKIRQGTILRKTHAYTFENGKNSMTNQVIRMGLQAVVVGKDGRAYDPEHWDQSGTFRQGSQENLLIADNQTDAYAHADQKMKCILMNRSWGEQGG